VLVAEDDARVRQSVARVLVFEGYQVEVVTNGLEALAAIARTPPDVIVLDVMMPVLDGLSACQQLRASGNRTPVLMLTARSEIADRVAGLDAGADDYVVKPFALDELLARLRALLRRRVDIVDTDSDDYDNNFNGEGVLRLADLTVDPLRRQVWRGERSVELTKTEFDLLELLVRNAGIVLTRDQIYERIWGYDFETSSKSLDVYISYLRRKIEEPDEIRLIHTVRGVGYSVRQP
ncbi:MAG: response regulator transcription factor, partial [Pseudonocardiaceae bacterium]